MSNKSKKPSEHSQPPEPTPACPTCSHYAHSLTQLQQKYKAQARKQRNLRTALAQLELHNNSIVENTDTTVREFQGHIVKLEREILQRDQIIGGMTGDVDRLAGENVRVQGEAAKGRERIKELEALVAKNAQQLSQLRSHILKQVSQKATTTRETSSQLQSLQSSHNRLQEELSSFEHQILYKEQLINSLSCLNNELRTQLIDLKGKLEIQDSTQISERKREGFVGELEEQIRALQRENGRLREINAGLQFQVGCLLRDMEEVQAVLTRAKMERDVYQKIVDRERPRSLDSKAGTIQRVNRKANCKPGQVPGLIRFSKPGQASLRTSVSNQIIQQDFQQSQN